MVKSKIRIIGALTSGSNATPSSGESAILSDDEIAQIYNQGFGNSEPYNKFDAADIRWLIKFEANSSTTPETTMRITNDGAGIATPGKISGSNYAAPIYDNYFEPF